MLAVCPQTCRVIIVRAAQDRKLADGGRLFGALADTAPLTVTSVKVAPRGPGDKGRIAKVALRAGRALIARPDFGDLDDAPEAIELTLVEASEIDAPAGKTALLWRLLTTHPVSTAAQAEQVVQLYRLRWRIEQIFRALKSDGLALDDSQLIVAPPPWRRPESGWIDHDNRKRRSGQRSRHHRLEAAGSLQRDHVRRHTPHPLDQAIQTGCIAIHRKDFPAGAHSNVQAVFRDVYSDNDDVHGDPSLPNRASLLAAQATVRVRWNGGRGAELTCGLARPRGCRAPARHRDPYLMRVAAMRVTRGFGLSIGRNPSHVLLLSGPCSPLPPSGRSRPSSPSYGEGATTTLRLF